MDKICSKYDILKQQLNELLTDDTKKVQAENYFSEFEKTLFDKKEYNPIEVSDIRKSQKRITNKNNSEFIFDQIESLIQERNGLSTDQIIVRGLGNAIKITQSKIGFFYFTGNTFKSATKIWPAKVKPDSISQLDILISKYCKNTIKSGKSEIKNQVKEILSIAKHHQIELRNYLIVPVIESDEIAGIFFLGNKSQDYTENDASQIMFLGINMWMLASQDRKEEALLLSENKFRILSQQISDFIWSCNLKGQITYVNQPTSDGTGYSMDELNTLNLQDLLSPQSKVFFKSKLKERLYKEKKGIKTVPADYIVEQIRKDGSAFWAETRISLHRNNSGKLVGFVGVTRDITQRLDNENTLRESEKCLLEAVAAKDKFLSIIAHDLKSPYSALVGLSEVLLEKHNKMVPENREEIIRSIYQSTLRTYNLLENLLDWSGMQTGRKLFKPEIVDISMLATDIVDLFSEMIKRKHIEFTIREDKNIKAYADTEMVSTVFRNLISNSLKYTPNYGKISIKLENHSEKLLKVTFSDTGLGISPTDLEKLFRIDASLSTPGLDNEKGTGLGLILCKEFVEKNGGTIRVKSKLKQGTSFIFTLQKSC